MIPAALGAVGSLAGGAAGGPSTSSASATTTVNGPSINLGGRAQASSDMTGKVITGVVVLVAILAFVAVTKGR